MSDPTHRALATIEPGETPQRLHPLVAAAIAHGPDPSTLRELLAVQREWESGEARKAYTRALVGLRADLPAVIQKDATVDYTSKDGRRVHYTHASLASAVEAVTPALTAHGFSVAWIPATADNRVSVTCRITHAEGHAEECTLSAAPDASGMKSPPQAIASTVTLLQRYTMLSLLGIATADMTEPQHVEPRPTDVDAARNLRAAAEIKRRGKSVEDARALVGRGVEDWTSADLDRLRTWLRGADAPDAPGGPTEMREPGED